MKPPGLSCGKGNLISLEDAAIKANEKLEKEGKILYCEFPSDQDASFSLIKFNEATHEALLLNIEPLEKCKHQLIKIKKIEHGDKSKLFNTPRTRQSLGFSYECVCGKKLRRIESFEEIP